MKRIDECIECAGFRTASERLTFHELFEGIDDLVSVGRLFMLLLFLLGPFPQ